MKYRQRYNWTHSDLLRKAHPKTPDKAMNDLFTWITKGEIPSPMSTDLRVIDGYEQAKTADVKMLPSLIANYGLTWEMIPPERLDQKEVWAELARSMPPVALLRNLATLTRLGVAAPMEAQVVVDRLSKIGNSVGVHPIAVLSALLIYRAGKGVKGQHTWNPVPQVVDALDSAFERSFTGAPQTNQRYYLGIDVSGSMDHGEVGGVPGLTPSMAAAAMAMVIARREPNYYMAGFAGPNTRYGPAIMAPLNIFASDSITDAMRKTQSMTFGGTDCAMPIVDALHQKMNVDCFIILTDNETWAGSMHPAEALRQYRVKSGIPAKLVVVAMVSNGFSIADPNDGGMLDIVGFDAAAPQLIADFATGGRADIPPEPEEE